jgi:copper chaperone CopZ
MITTTITVNGMSCGHCVRAVTQVLSSIAGVQAVAVDLESGLVTITSDAPLAGAALAGAVDQAGYEVAP